MGRKVSTYDEKADYEQRCRSRHNKHAYPSSESSNSSSTSCNDESCDDCSPNTRPVSYLCQSPTAGKFSSSVTGQMEGKRKVRFVVEQPLPAGWVANWNWDVAQKRESRTPERFQDKETEKREKVDAWWRNGCQGLEPDDSDEEDEFEDIELNEENEES